MVESLLHMRSEVSSALKAIGEYDMCLRAQDWVLLEEMATFLRTFRGLTELVSSSTTSLSLTPIIRAEVTDACKPKSTDSDELKAMKSKISNNWDQRFPLTTNVMLATLLDPTTRALLTLTEDKMEGRHAV